jgi:putative hydrolase of the HAD superfamily
MALRALLFDFDGLIIDTESAIYEVWRELYAQHGHKLEVATWAQCVGADFVAYDPKAELERLTGSTFDWEATEKALEARAREIVRDYPALPGVRDMLEAAKEAGVPCSVASSSPLSWAEGWLVHLGLREYFANVSCRDHVERIKPAPDLYLHAAGKLGVEPGDVVVFEDSLNGLRAALAAGMKCITVPGPLTRHLDLSAAWKQASSLAEVKLEDLQQALA